MVIYKKKSHKADVHFFSKQTFPWLQEKYFDSCVSNLTIKDTHVICRLLRVTTVQNILSIALNWLCCIHFPLVFIELGKLKSSHFGTHMDSCRSDCDHMHRHSYKYIHSHSPSVDPFSDFVPFHGSSHLTDLSISSLHNSTISSSPIRLFSFKQSHDTNKY